MVYIFCSTLYTDKTLWVGTVLNDVTNGTLTKSQQPFNGEVVWAMPLCLTVPSGSRVSIIDGVIVN